MRKVMKKFLFLTIALLITNNVFAYEVTKNEEYYKSQIQNQRLLYNVIGLVNAIQKGNNEALELFMKAGFSANESSMGTPLTMFALYAKNYEALDILLNYGADPEQTIPPFYVTAKGQNLLSYSIIRKSSSSVESLIKHKVDVNKKYNGYTPLNLAISKKQTRIVELLLKAGAKPDEKTLKAVNKSKDEYLKDLFTEYIGNSEK
jgi:hypothetical protein